MDGQIDRDREREKERVGGDWQRLREKTLYTLGISGHGSPAVTRKSAINDLSMFSCGREK